jgi:dihydropyrimidine dehydrogenase (NADP+)
MGVMGINLDTLRPEPCVEGYSIPGGYSSKAIRPIALAKVMSIAQMMKAEFPGSDFSLSGVGGVETGNDAAEFILLGANTVQVKLQLHQCHDGVFFLLLLETATEAQE